MFLSCNRRDIESVRLPLFLLCTLIYTCYTLHPCLLFLVRSYLLRRSFSLASSSLEVSFSDLRSPSFFVLFHESSLIVKTWNLRTKDQAFQPQDHMPFQRNSSALGTKTFVSIRTKRLSGIKQQQQQRPCRLCCWKFKVVCVAGIALFMGDDKLGRTKAPRSHLQRLLRRRQQ